ncbi:MAG: HAD-IA family hydrolase [Rhodobacteraceae bacterium]|nr:HAD-IA family hydrolase [Paracoccaceae bacterium]
MSGRLVVFDVDGTLVDSQRQILASMAAAFALLGRPMPPRAVALSVVGLSLPQALARLMPDVGAADLARMEAEYRAGFAGGGEAGQAPLYPGARAALDGLAAREGVLLGVATGKSRRGLNRVLAHHRLAGHFATTQVADDHPSKPHPAMLLAALAETGAAPGVMVGDTSFDIEMGRAAGFRTIGVAWGYHPVAALHAAGADLVIGGFAELAGALEALE